MQYDNTITEQGMKTLEIANSINLWDSIPQVKIGDVVSIYDVWNGDYDKPEESYSYRLTDCGYDGESDYDVWIDYQFTIVDNTKELVEITNIELL